MLAQISGVLAIIIFQGAAREPIQARVRIPSALAFSFFVFKKESWFFMYIQKISFRYTFILFDMFILKNAFQKGIIFFIKILVFPSFFLTITYFKFYHMTTDVYDHIYGKHTDVGSNFPRCSRSLFSKEPRASLYRFLSAYFPRWHFSAQLQARAR